MCKNPWRFGNVADFCFFCGMARLGLAVLGRAYIVMPGFLRRILKRGKGMIGVGHEWVCTVFYSENLLAQRPFM